MGWGYINFEILSEKLCNLWGLRLNFIPVYGGPYYEFSFPICYQVSLFRLTLSSNPISCVTMRIKTFEISVKVNVYNIFIMVMVWSSNTEEGDPFKKFHLMWLPNLLGANQFKYCLPSGLAITLKISPILFKITGFQTKVNISNCFPY